MASINQITGKEMVTKAATDDYRIGHERIFGKKGAQPAEEQKVCEPCRNTGAIHCSDPVNCGGPWSDPLPNKDCMKSPISSRVCERGVKGCEVRHTNSIASAPVENLSNEQLLNALLESAKEDITLGLASSNETDALRARVLKRMALHRNDRAVYSAMADNYNNDRAKASEGRR